MPFSQQPPPAALANGSLLDLPTRIILAKLDSIYSHLGELKFPRLEALTGALRTSAEESETEKIRQFTYYKPEYNITDVIEVLNSRRRQPG